MTCIYQEMGGACSILRSVPCLSPPAGPDGVGSVQGPGGPGHLLHQMQGDALQDPPHGRCIAIIGSVAKLVYDG